MEATQNKYSSAALLNWLRLFGFIALVAFLFFVVIPFLQVKYDDLRYGRPRVFHLQADLNPNDESTEITHLYAFNVDGQARVIIFPAKANESLQELRLPYIPGRSRGNVVPRLTMVPVTSDAYPDLIIDLDGELIMYVAENGGFRLANDSEFLQLALLENPS